MERSKMKLAVIFLLAAVNLFLLGSVVLQRQQSQGYEAAVREQILIYLDKRNITVDPETIPWESALTAKMENLPDQLLDPAELPAEGLPAACEIQPALEAPALLVDFALAAEDAGLTPLVIQSIREGYQYSGEADRAVLTPMWELTTDRGTFLLSGAEGTLQTWK